jgi:hypothetical protein
MESPAGKVVAIAAKTIGSPQSTVLSTIRSAVPSTI